MPVAATYEGTLRIATLATLSPRVVYSMPMTPAGTSILSRPTVRGRIRPCSSANVTMPIVPWPHMGRQPLVSMNRMAASLAGSMGGNTNPPDIMSWPRGSNISPSRIQSKRVRKSWRRSLMLAPLRNGAPPATSRTGLPAVCPSMQKKTDFMTSLSRGPQSELRGRPRRRGIVDQGGHCRAPLSSQGKTWGTNPFRATSHDLLGKLDGLHQIMLRVEVQQGHEP